MPESKVRKGAKENLKRKREAEKAEEAVEHNAADDASDELAVGARVHSRTRGWVPWVFIPLGLLGVLWMVVYQLAGNEIGFMRSLGDWNVLIGLGLIIASFSFMTLWK